jgi:hypothetical protein
MTNRLERMNYFLQRKLIIQKLKDQNLTSSHHMMNIIILLLAHGLWVQHDTEHYKLQNNKTQHGNKA